MLPRAHTDRTDLTGFSFVGGKSHGGSTVCGFLWTHTDFARFNEKIICGNLWWFVAVFLEHGLHGLYGYVGFVESC